ncbi:MAG: Adenosine deaminase [Verrucomicrobiales bacterium]|nr:Adenosine deaminase [Verrucomicrobiales bacterium]
MKCFDSKYNAIPKTEIHCHLEGAIRTSTIIDVAKQYGLKLPSHDIAGLDPHVKVLEQLKNLDAVLRAFRIAQNSITSVDVVERIAWEAFEDAAKQNIKLFEVRFSPDFAFSGHKIDWDAGLKAILRAKQRAQEKFGMAIGLIAISSRSMGMPSCEKTVDWAIQQKKEIHAFDLADGELTHPIQHFIGPVLRAKNAGLKITIHSGEDTNGQAVIDTICAVEPDRIGHGVRIIHDQKAIDLVKSRGVTLELNPWSNYLTNAVDRIEEHPLKRLFDMGVKVTISSDDPEVLETNLNNEYRIAHEVLGMSLDDIKECNRNAIAASFIPKDDLRKVATFFN